MSVGLANKRARIIVLTVIAVLLVIGGIWAFAVRNAQNESSQSQNEITAEGTPTEVEEAQENETEPVEAPIEENPAPTVDPATVSSVDIEPLGVSVAYVRGIPGFEYSVARTQSSTQYVNFSSPDLAGTKCTGDTGVFATILKNPSEGDSATLTSTKDVGSDTFGLSLPQATCTSDPALFSEFQTSFKDAFGLISSLDTTSTED